MFWSEGTNVNFNQVLTMFWSDEMNVNFNQVLMFLEVRSLNNKLTAQLGTPALHGLT